VRRVGQKGQTDAWPALVALAQVIPSGGDVSLTKQWVAVYILYDFPAD